MSKTIEELARVIEGSVVGDGKIPILGITNIETPGPGLICFAQDEKGLRKLEHSEIACVIVPPTLHSSAKPLIQAREPKLAWAKLLREFHPSSEPSRTISPLAFVSKSARVGRRVTIEPFAMIADGAEIGDECVIHSQVSVGRNVKIKDKTILYPGVVLYENTQVGSSVIIHGGSVIGADGFGYVHTAEGQQKVPQVGNVIIEDDVEIGACTTIDRATVGSTKIGQGCKIDNLVQIAHNVTIGPHTVVSAQTGISGSSKVGAHVTMGGKVGLGDHVEIGDWTIVGAGAGFPSGKKVGAKQIVFGEPARPYQEARKQIAAQLRSAEMLEGIRSLRKRVAELEKQIGRSGAVSPDQA